MTNKKAHVLIAEDDTFLAEIMQKTLHMHGVRASVAHDGQQAIDLISTSPPDLLLLDLLMPQLDGFAVLEHMRKQKNIFPVVVLSNLSDESHRERCTKLGVIDYFVKSDMDDDGLWLIVEKYLQKS